MNIDPSENGLFSPNSGLKPGASVDAQTIKPSLLLQHSLEPAAATLITKAP